MNYAKRKIHFFTFLKKITSQSNVKQKKKRREKNYRMEKDSNQI